MVLLQSSFIGFENRSTPKKKQQQQSITWVSSRTKFHCYPMLQMALQYNLYHFVMEKCHTEYSIRLLACTHNVLLYDTIFLSPYLFLSISFIFHHFSLPFTNRSILRIAQYFFIFLYFYFVWLWVVVCSMLFYFTPFFSTAGSCIIHTTHTVILYQYDKSRHNNYVIT